MFRFSLKLNFMKGFKKFIFYWLPPIGWMMFIFSLSSQTRVSLTHQVVSDFIFFKSLHMLEYAVLYGLLFRALYQIDNKIMSLKNKFILPIIIGFIYSFTDELHQLFVPTRSGQLRDTGFDLLGILLMYTLIKRYLKQLKKYL